MPTREESATCACPKCGGKLREDQQLMLDGSIEIVGWTCWRCAFGQDAEGTS